MVVRKIRGVNVISLPGNPDVSYEPYLDQIPAMLSEGERHFLLDLREVSWLDSAYIGAMAKVLKEAQEQKGAVKLLVSRASPFRKSPSLRQLLDQLFECFEAEEKALASFRQSEE